jgi:hypothetical protein
LEQIAHSRVLLRTQTASDLKIASIIFPKETQ